CGRRPQPRGTTGNHENINIQVHGSSCSARSTAPGLCHGDIMVRCRQAEQCSKASTCLTVLDTAANSTGRLKSVVNDSRRGRSIQPEKVGQKLPNISSCAYRLSPRPPSCVPPSAADLSGLNNPTSGIRLRC